MVLDQLGSVSDSHFFSFDRPDSSSVPNRSVLEFGRSRRAAKVLGVSHTMLTSTF